MSYKGPSVTGAGDAPGRSSRHQRAPAASSPSHRDEQNSSYGSSSPTDPALPGGSAWEKFYAPKTHPRKGFAHILLVPACPPQLRPNVSTDPGTISTSCGKSCGMVPFFSSVRQHVQELLKSRMVWSGRLYTPAM